MTPRPYQIEAASRHAANLKRFGVTVDGSDTGTGKTFVAALTAKSLGWPVAVVCPKSVIPSWKETLAVMGITPLFVENLERIRWDQKHARRAKKGWEWNLPCRCLLIFDEAHRCTGSDSQNAMLLMSAPKPVMIVSATLADSPLKMRAVGHQLGIVHWDEWYRWCFAQGCQKNLPFQGLKFTGGEDVLLNLHQKVFGEKGVRIRVADLGDAFPENQVVTVAVPVDETDALDQEYYSALEALEQDAKSAGEMLLRARQKSEHLKLPAVIEMIDDAMDQGASVAVFMNFTDTLDRLRQAFPDAGTIHGGQTADEREEAIRKFQSNESRVILAMVQAGGVGVSLHDLHGGHPRVSLIFPTWSAVEMRQALGRIHRNGGKTPCLQKILFAADTVEERVRRKVDKKLDNIDLINDGDMTLTEL
jgi:superfamily II DNA or RNA helicase